MYRPHFHARQTSILGSSQLLQPLSMPNLLEFETPFPFSVRPSDRQFSASHRLCSLCERIFVETHFRDPRDDDAGEHHETLEALKASAAEGCQLCFMIVTHSNQLTQSWTVESSHLKWWVTSKFAPLENGMPMHTALVIRRLHSFLCISCPERPENYAITKAVASNSTGSEESLTAAKRWLSECRTGHAECNKRSSASGWLPTRLVDVGVSNASSAEPTRLRLSEGIAPKEPYLTLSHR